MTNIILSGCCGKMGGVVSSKVAAGNDFRIVAGVDIVTPSLSYPVYTSWDAIPEDTAAVADCIVDFSNPSCLAGLLRFAEDKQVPAVICTTGLSDAQKEDIKLVSEKVALFFSANMSLGVNLLSALSAKAAKILGNNFDIEIVEMHHNQKIDAPSGTAYMLAQAINAEFDNSLNYEYNRHDKREKRSDREIGIHSIRGGNITGEHQVIFAGQDEVITLSHSARSRNLFANGALSAAAFMKGKGKGLYDMNDLINEE